MRTMSDGPTSRHPTPHTPHPALRNRFAPPLPLLFAVGLSCFCQAAWRVLGPLGLLLTNRVVVRWTGVCGGTSFFGTSHMELREGEEPGYD